MMRYIVAYDIADDRRRDRVVTALLDYGQRVQESVFACYIDPARKAELVGRVAGVISSTEDRVHVMPLCAQCWAGAEVLGLADKPVDPEFYIA